MGVTRGPGPVTQAPRVGAGLSPVIRALGVASFALLLAPAAGCVQPNVATMPTISLRMAGSPPEALVVIDEEAVGQLDFIALHGVALPPGLHHVSVKARGYFSWDREVEAKPGGAPIRVDVALVPVPD
jgi:hypothetical protein